MADTLFAENKQPIFYRSFPSMSIALDKKTKDLPEKGRMGIFELLDFRDPKQNKLLKRKMAKFVKSCQILDLSRWILNKIHLKFVSLHYLFFLE